MPKVENWTAGSRLLSFGWLVAWVVAGSISLFIHNLSIGALYLGLWVAQYVSCRVPVRAGTRLMRQDSCSVV